MTNNKRVCYFDVHCHFHDCPEQLEQLQNVSQIDKLCLMGTSPADWEEIVRWKQAHPERIQLAFGIHPWYVEKYADSKKECMELLIDYLERFPEAIVGEIGIDKVAKNIEGKRYDFDLQLEFFREQLLIAARLKRPVSIHCVRCYGSLISELQKIVPERIMLHSYTGSRDSLNLLYKDAGIAQRLYVSVSDTISLRSDNWRSWIHHIPRERLLLESDLHQLGQAEFVMERVTQHLAAELKMSVLCLADQCWRNAIRFFPYSRFGVPTVKFFPTLNV